MASLLSHTLLEAHPEGGDYSALNMVKLLKIPVGQMAQILGVSRQALHKNPSSSRLQEPLRRLDRMLVSLVNLTDSLEHGRIWLKAGHPDFDDKPPLGFLLEGQFEPVEDLIEAIEMGLPG